MMVRTALLLTVLCLCVAGCRRDVTIEKHADGSETVTVRGPRGNTVVKTDDGETTLSDGKGSQATLKSDSNGTSEIHATGPNGEKTTVTTGKNVDLAPYGVSLYPGLTVEDHATSNIVTEQGEVASVIGITGDDFKKVGEFYQKMLKGVSHTETPEGIMVTGKTDKGADVMVIATKKDGKTEVTMSASLKKK